MAAQRYALIMGGELRNKGAQAMSFIAVEQVKKRFPELIPVLLSNADARPNLYWRLKGVKPREDFSRLAFTIEHPMDAALYHRLTGDATENTASARGPREAAKMLVFGREWRRTATCYGNAALCLDISGFNFGDKWGFDACQAYLDRHAFNRELGIPTYILPQSFGPFEFDGAGLAAGIASAAADILPHARMIFARERDGYEALRGICPGANIIKSDDLVLQSAPLDTTAIFTAPPKMCTHLPADHAGTVGIVPNARNYDHGDKAVIDGLYRKLIATLLSEGRRVALIRHASEDLAFCERIKAMFPDDERVEVFGEDRYCFEYEELFSRCDVLVASRFHSIVHAYKCGVPCIALGWAVKYAELLERVGQADLAFDVTAADFDPDGVIASVEYALAHRDELSGRITTAVAQAQRENVFDAVEADFRSL